MGTKAVRLNQNTLNQKRKIMYSLMVTAYNSESVLTALACGTSTTATLLLKNESIWG